jgi:hypothetical protein
LIGSVLRFFFPRFYGNKDFFYVVQMIIIIILVNLVIYHAYRFISKQKDEQSFVFVFLVFSLPFSIAFFAIDIGRFDQINYLIALTILIFLDKVPTYFRWFLLTVMLFIMSLIHEASLLLVYPLILAYIMLIDIKKYKNLKSFINLFCLPVIITLLPTLIANWFFLINQIELVGDSYEKLFLSLNSLANFTPVKDSVLIHFYNTGDNLKLTFSSYLSPFRLFGIILTILIAFLYLIVPYKIMIRFFEKSEINTKFMGFLKITLIIMLLLPILLSFIGLDTQRWISAVVFNYYMAIVLLGFK